MQIDAQINQDQTISKDLTLWNQQGSQVVRGQTLVLPADDTFLYVEPIYIQATEARMPQLKKVVLAEGNTLIYADTYDQALAQYGPAMVSRVDFARGRVRPSFAVDVSAGAELYRRDQWLTTLQADIQNLNNRLNVLDFGGLFSGNAIAPPRSYMLRLQTSF